jgi:hypothetical protein
MLARALLQVNRTPAPCCEDGIFWMGPAALEFGVVRVTTGAVLVPNSARESSNGGLLSDCWLWKQRTLQHSNRTCTSRRESPRSCEFP